MGCLARGLATSATRRPTFRGGRSASRARPTNSYCLLRLCRPIKAKAVSCAITRCSQGRRGDGHGRPLLIGRPILFYYFSLTVTVSAKGTYEWSTTCNMVLGVRNLSRRLASTVRGV